MKPLLWLPKLRVYASLCLYLHDTGVFGKTTTTEKIVTKVKDYFWDFRVHYQIFAFRGNDPNEKVLLQERKGGCELKTNANVTPQPSTSGKAFCISAPNLQVPVPIDVNITWLLTKINDNNLVDFQIDRTSKDCHTPRRNPEVDVAFEFFRYTTLKLEL